MAWTEEDIHRLRSGFDSRTLPGSEFNHSAHIAVGTTYVCELGADDAMTHLRESIPRYNESQGGENTDTSGYHETLTRFWVDRLAEFVAGLPAGTSPAASALAAVEKFGPQTKLHQQYYSFDVVKSLEARRGWVPPDQTPAGAARLAGALEAS